MTFPSSSLCVSRAVVVPEAYSSRWEPLGLPRVVLFIVLEEEKNELDHRRSVFPEERAGAQRGRFRAAILSMPFVYIDGMA